MKIQNCRRYFFCRVPLFLCIGTVPIGDDSSRSRFVICE
jgi:hypothetical protein